MGYYIVGTKHPLQKSSSTFREKLKSIINDRHVVLIAEEINPNKPEHLQKSQGRDLASSQTPNIPWVSIDMTSEQQKQAGIFDVLEKISQFPEAQKLYPKRANAHRENYWLDRIESKCHQEGITDGIVLITCGRNHLDFLAAKAEQRGFTVVKDEFPDGLGEALENQLGKLEILDL